MKRTIERPKPPYAQVADALREEILHGRLAPGSPIPSEREIAEQWGVSRATATKAVASLKSQGLVESEVGIGTKVSHGDGAITWSPRDRYRHTKRTGRQRTGSEESDFTTEVIEAPPDVCEALGLARGGLAISRSRITRDRGTVVELSTSWFDAGLEKTCPALLEGESIEQGTTNYVAEETGAGVGSAVENVRAELATADDAKHYGLELPAAMLVTELTVFDQHGDPLAYEVYRQPPRHRSMYEYDL